MSTKDNASIDWDREDGLQITNGSFKYMLNKLSQTDEKGRPTKSGLDGELKTPHS
jgi:hypothetical protein